MKVHMLPPVMIYLKYRDCITKTTYYKYIVYYKYIILNVKCQTLLQKNTQIVYSGVDYECRYEAV